MLTTIEAEIDVNGSVTFLEPLKINKKSRAIITLLDEKDDAPELGAVKENGTAAAEWTGSKQTAKNMADNMLCWTGLDF